MTTNVKCLSDTVIISEYWVLSMLHILYREWENPGLRLWHRTLAR